MFAVVGGIKGGAGKTIMARCCGLRAAAGREVLLVDGDDQESTTLWSATRNEVLGVGFRQAILSLGLATPSGGGGRVPPSGVGIWFS